MVTGRVEDDLAAKKGKEISEDNEITCGSEEDRKRKEKTPLFVVF